MALAIEFRILGDVEVYLNDRPVEIGYAQLRFMLVILLMEANRSVPLDQIVARVWEGRKLPHRPRAAVQHNITMLRHALADAADEVTISRYSAGYQISVDPSAVDLHQFGGLLDQARVAATDNDAAALFEQALRLWRGEPCAGLDTLWISSFRARLGARRDAAWLDLVDVQLRLGRHEALLVDLSNQTEQRPLDERLAGQYMLALYRSGRQALALAHYQRIRHRLVDQLGTDPGRSLQRLHQRILAADPMLAVSATSAAGTSSTAVPRQLPAPPRYFAGRSAELDEVTGALNASDDGTMKILAIGGIGGIGKTWLALRWAHQHLDRFPDGQLYLNLRGFDPTGRPMATATAVRAFLGALGVDSFAVPADEEAQGGLYRSLVANRRILVVLDNARDADQVIPLLPGSATCTVLVTSRHRLTGLIAGHGAHIMDLDVLSAEESRNLVSRRLGSKRLADEPIAAAELLDGCAGLPLALGIVAARAASHPDFPLASLAEELHDHAGRLDILDGGELATNVRAVLSWSLHATDDETATVFTLLGLVPGPDISTAAVASLTALPTTRIRTVLRRLADASLVQQHLPGRYRLHDLVRRYAAEQAAHSDTAGLHVGALQRLVDFYVHTAFSAEQLLQSLLPSIQLGRAAGGCRPDALADKAGALAWFTAEYPNLLASQRAAADQGWAVSVWQLAWVTTTFLYRQGRFTEALTAWRGGEAAAGQLDDPTIRNGTHQMLGAIFSELGRHDEAFHHLNMAERFGDLASHAYTHHALGWLWSLRGDNRRALHYAERSLRRYQSLGIPAGEARELTVIAWYWAQLAEYENSRAYCATAMALARRHRYVEDEALVLGIRGYDEYHNGQYQSAVDYLQQSAALLREVGNTYYEATVLDYLGCARRAAGETSSARQAWQLACVLYQAQHRLTEAERVQERLDPREQDEVAL